VAGARAQFKGEGTVNGVADYGFMLTVTDGALLYDNNTGADDGDNPTTLLTGVFDLFGAVPTI